MVFVHQYTVQVKSLHQTIPAAPAEEVSVGEHVADVVKLRRSGTYRISQGEITPVEEVMFKCPHCSAPFKVPKDDELEWVSDRETSTGGIELVRRDLFYLYYKYSCHHCGKMFAHPLPEDWAREIGMRIKEGEIA